MMPPVASRADVAAGLLFGRAKVRPGRKVLVGTDTMRRLATRTEDSYVNVRRDGPRRLDEGSVPYWQTFPDPLHQPLVEAAGPGRVRQQLALFKQGLVDSSVGACALVLALYHTGRLNKDFAQLLLGHHARHVVQAVGMSAWIILLLCLL